MLNVLCATAAVVVLNSRIVLQENYVAGNCTRWLIDVQGLQLTFKCLNGCIQIYHERLNPTNFVEDIKHKMSEGSLSFAWEVKVWCRRGT